MSGERLWPARTLLLLLLGYLAFLYAREAWLRIPIVLEPRGGVLASTELALDWNPLPGGAPAYEVEVSEAAGKVVYEAKVDAPRVRAAGILIRGGSYTWRVRSLGGRWSTRHSFTVAAEPGRR